MRKKRKKNVYMLNDACFKVSPTLSAGVTLERIGGGSVYAADFEVLLIVIQQAAPIDHFVCLDELEEVTFCLNFF